MTRLCYCIEDDCPLPHGSLEFPPGLCVDCGMSVPGGDIICDQCKSAWQTFSFSGLTDAQSLETGMPEMWQDAGTVGQEPELLALQGLQQGELPACLGNMETDN
jgi:hypothetical protein